MRNEDLQLAVEEALKYEPSLHAAEIGVIADDGVITLNGTVDTFAKKAEAEIAAKNVLGVKAVIENITVDDGLAPRTDFKIAEEIVGKLRGSLLVPDEQIFVKVRKGHVTAEGEVRWNFQRNAAIDEIRDVEGVKGIINKIKVHSEIIEQLEKTEVERALRRNWSIKAENIHVKVDHHTVHLSGFVESVYQKDTAENIAWNAPGVRMVVNDLIVDY